VRTTTWEFKTNIVFNKIPDLQAAGGNFLRDIFAFWYIITDPRVPGQAERYNFGYRDDFNGIGVFVY
jgi:hypothetical protein